jgi:hypothetical protein
MNSIYHAVLAGFRGWTPDAETPHGRFGSSAAIMPWSLAWRRMARWSASGSLAEEKHVRRRAPDRAHRRIAVAGLDGIRLRLLDRLRVAAAGAPQ